jgi:hypothetical protein
MLCTAQPREGREALLLKSPDPSTSRSQPNPEPSGWGDSITRAAHYLCIHLQSLSCGKLLRTQAQAKLVWVVRSHVGRAVTGAEEAAPLGSFSVLHVGLDVGSTGFSRGNNSLVVILWFVLFVAVVSTGIWTQDFALVRQALYCLSHASSPFYSGCFGSVWRFAQAWTIIFFYASTIAVMPGIRHYAQLVSTEMGSWRFLCPLWPGTTVLPTWTSSVAAMTGMCHWPQVLVEMGSCEIFAWAVLKLW